MSAIGNDVITRLTGFKQLPGNFNNVTPNLPVVIAIFSEINTSEQGVITLDDNGVPIPTQITNAQQAASLAGWGSPLYQAAKILFPNLSGIPVYAYPQLTTGSTAKVMTVTATGTATGNGTHYVTICGRKSVGGQTYAVNIVSGDDAGIIHVKIADAVNNVLGSPMTAVDTDYLATLTSKWKGLTADEIKVSIDTNGNDLGMSYSVVSTQSGSGTPDVTDSLNLFGNKWIPCVLNGYGLAATVISAFQDFNGVPVIGENEPTGRYLPTVFKPFLATSGFTSEDPSATTDALLNQVTIATSPAPLSDGLSIEAAANHMLMWAKCLQDTPELDIIGRSYSDMPTPKSIGLMASWEERDRIVKKGCSTVDLVGGAYQFQDPVTTYHPIGEFPPQFRYIRNLGIDWNTRFTYMLLEEVNVLGKVILNDGDAVAPNVKAIKPKIWKAILSDMALQMVARGLWVDAQFTIDSIQVSISTVNPDRFMTSFSYKRSGVVRQSDTEATAGFNVGVLTAN